LKQPLLNQATILKKTGGLIPLGPLKKTTDPHVMLVGDAAAQVKPTSGGGLYPGLVCATHCTDTALHAIQQQRFDTPFLNTYHTTWTKTIGRELAHGMTFRKLYSHLTDTQLSKYIKKFNNKKTRTIINTYGDIDYPSKLGLPLVYNTPSLLRLFPTLLKHTKR
jgi:flavin-dependent dehydrogenase